MELKQIKELMALMEKSGVKKLSIKEKSGFELQMERHEETPSAPTVHYHPPIHTTHPLYSHSHPVQREVDTSAQKAVSEESISPEKKEAAGKFVVSPMVGTFYSSPSPDDPSFVKVGDRVDENTVVCIIEAMKVMNEVKAGISGTIAEVYLENAQPVEFGTKIFRIV